MGCYRFLQWMCLLGSRRGEIPANLLSSYTVSPQQRDGEGEGREGSVLALGPGSCFINSRLILHTCAVLGDISGYTRQARVHRFFDSFPKREAGERNRPDRK